MTVSSVTIKSGPTPAVAPVAPTPVVAPVVAPVAVTPAVNPGNPPKELAPAALNPTNAVAPKPVERPAWLPTKFKDAEQMATAYAALEKKMGGGEPVAEPVVAPVVDPAAAKPVADQGTADLLKTAGFDYAKLTGEVQKTGDLSKESYDGLYAKFGKEVVDQHISGMKASASVYAGKIYDMAGGADTYGKVMDWAKANVPANEVVAFNAAVSSGDLSSAKLAVDGVMAKYNAAIGTEPSLLNGSSGLNPGAAGDVYRSYAQVTADMRDPRYQKDPAYRADVEAKIARSPNL